MSSNSLTLQSEYFCFGGTVSFYSHLSTVCNGEMRFSIYQPPQAKARLARSATPKEPLPVLYFLAGLTCTEENFMVKAGAQRFAAQHGIILVAPDTSPRKTGIAGEDETWDFGSGAGFYVDATAEPWSSHYRMYSYVTEELPSIVHQHFPTRSSHQGIFGHSMGGHGALVCALRNPDRYRSVSAFAPIAAPMQCQWGQKALSNYLGHDQSHWKSYDASELVRIHSIDRTILIDQGENDPFLATQLLPDRFEEACKDANQSLVLRRHANYDHSYYFISSFIEDHLNHHAAALNQ